MRIRIFTMAFLMFFWLGDFGLAFWHKTNPTTGREVRRENSSPLESNPSSTTDGLGTAAAGSAPTPEPLREPVAEIAKEAGSNPRAAIPFPGFASGPSLLGMSLQSSGALLLVLTIILLGTYFLKKMLPGRFGSFAHKRHLKMVETLSLGDKRSLHLLQVGDQMILLGSTSSQITVLQQIENLPAHSAWAALDGAKSKSQRTVSEDHSACRSSFAKLFSRKGRSTRSLASRRSESNEFENILGKAIHGRPASPSREAGDHASRLAALRESLQSHQQV